MTTQQALILGILALTVAMFVFGRWRHDMVAMGSLLLCVFSGLVSPDAAFAGFGHPAVITVACVLVLSRALQTTGAVDALTRKVLPASAGPTLTIAAITGLAAVLSAFMNNVGALALLMPVAIQISSRLNLPPGRVLMPLAFGSILGGMTTLIGTPPNLIVSGFRAQQGAGSYGLFDFSPVGVAVAGAGVLFVALVGWRLVPARTRAGVEGFDTGAYLTEAKIVEGGKSDGKSLRDLGPILEASDAQIVGRVRGSHRVAAISPDHILHADDILAIEAEPESLAQVLSSLGLTLVEDVKEKDKPTEKTLIGPEAPKPVPQDAEVVLQEIAVRPDADLIGRSATDLQLRSRHGINLLALSRQGRRSIKRLRSERFLAGDVLLMQGSAEAINAFASDNGCVPLARREIRVPDPRRAVLASIIMGLAVAGAAFGLLPAAVAFAAGVLASMAFKVTPVRTVYEAVDWPVVVLLAALIPVADAMATTGAADLVSRALLENVAQGHAVMALVLILVVTMTLSDFMNNAATAAVMCPIALSTATQLTVNADSFLMAVAIGASCAFLTPIGHQNNTLILGPGGLRFGDYWRLGLPLELLVIAVAVPALLHFWPL